MHNINLFLSPRVFLFSTICVFALFLAGCPSKDSSAISAGGGHAKAGVVVGSHDDWCGEHGVAESQCTRCHPELIPAFQATKDWCVEHHLPESQCLQCNPGLKIVRPAKTP